MESERNCLSYILRVTNHCISVAIRSILQKLIVPYVRSIQVPWCGWFEYCDVCLQHGTRHLGDGTIKFENKLGANDYTLGVTHRL